MLLHPASSLYGAATAWRRRWYRRHPDRVRQLASPVISVGNLSVGGSGKTPVVEHLARLLQQEGERPAILTRGYARQHATPGVTVVSDTTQVVAGLDQAGDEPLMLARALPGVPVLVTADRFEAGALAEQRFGTTVHLLDDGFQHVMLARDLDLLLIDAEDLRDRPLPAGRLREPLATASSADAWLIPQDSGIDDDVRKRFGARAIFHVRRTIGVPYEFGRHRITPVARVPAVAVAGIARPQRFFDALRAHGWSIADAMAFPDHHPFSAGDVERMIARLHGTGARLVLMTEKDAARLEAVDVRGLPVAVVPLSVTLEPGATFRDWVVDRLRAARASSPARTGLLPRRP